MPRTPRGGPNGRPLATNTRLGKILVHKQLVASEVAKSVGMSWITMKRLVSGEKLMTMDEAIVLADVLEVPARVLLEDGPQIRQRIN